jgi:heat shock protein HtpX
MEHSMNLFKTGLLMAGLTALLMAFGFVIGRETGMVMALVFAIGTNLFTYWNADKMVLRMNGARQIERGDAPEFYTMIERLAARAALPMPKVYLMEQDQPNAFATGRNPANAAVAATTGLIRRLSPDEIEGVMAHELAHVKNRDTLIMAVAATLAGAISMLANFGMFMPRDRDSQGNMFSTLAMMFLAPMAAMIVQMAVSRTREYSADRTGAEISGKPLALASALRRIDATARGIPNNAAEANPAMAHVFIINPLHGGFRDNLFSTHRATENRVAELEKLAGEMPAAARPVATGPWG